MKFLHTADWHVGKPLRNRRREDEYAAALAQVLDIARDEQVDCVLVAGDVFDSAVPPPEAEEVVFGFFRELIGARIPAAVVGGNHDHARRLNAFARVLDLVDIRVRGEPVLPDEGGVLEVGSRDGSQTAVIAALPWVNERKVRAWEALLQGDEHFADYGEQVAQMIKYLCSTFRADTVNILLAHLMMDGALVGGEGSGERPLHVGQAYAVKPQRLPAEAQYIALGHLHRPQAILPGRAFYSGSLLQLDFGEAGQQKSVYVIDAQPGRPADVRAVPITAGRGLRDVGRPGAGVTLEEMKPPADDAGDEYLRIFVAVDRPVPGLAEQVREMFPNAVAVIPEYAEPEEQAETAGAERRSPSEMFTEYYRRGHKSDPPEEVMGLFERLYHEVTHEAD
jgi:DNA repair protein SbcD/Mre11